MVTVAARLVAVVVAADAPETTTLKFRLAEPDVSKLRRRLTGVHAPAVTAASLPSTVSSAATNTAATNTVTTSTTPSAEGAAR